MVILSYIISIMGIGFLIFIHELGHFLFCKLFGIPAPKFAIGVGPKIFCKKYGETEYSIGIIPIAGYVQISEGSEVNESEVSIIFKYPLIQGFFTIFGGILCNLLFAYLVITSIVVLNENKIQETSLKLFYPHEHMIIKDKEGNSIFLNYNCYLDLIQYIKDSEFTLEDIDGEKIVFENKAFFDSHFIIENNMFIHESLIDKIYFGISLTNNIIKQSFFGIINIFKGINLKKLCGPIGIVKQSKDAISKSFVDFLLFIAFISINLAVLNIVPIPMLDGGQFLFLLIYKIIRKKIPNIIETGLTFGSLAIIALMTLLSTYNDLLRVFFN